MNCRPLVLASQLIFVKLGSKGVGNNSDMNAGDKYRHKNRSADLAGLVDEGVLYVLEDDVHVLDCQQAAVVEEEGLQQHAVVAVVRVRGE
jgi:hypothetical protein